MLLTPFWQPLEVIKVRIQTAQILGVQAESFPAAASALHAKGGPLLLWTPGLAATWARAFGFTGLRVGLYPAVRSMVGGDKHNASLGTKVLAGATTGAIGSAIANPVDLVRTRMQAQAGRPTLYPSSVAVVRAVHAEGGVAALWRGVSATAGRATLLSGAQLATYDELKGRIKAQGYAEEGSMLHAFCGVVSGVVAQTVCQPADTIKSRVLAGGFTSVWACLQSTLRSEGGLGLFRGYIPAVCRQAPVVLVQVWPLSGNPSRFACRQLEKLAIDSRARVAQMPLIETIRNAAGLGSL